MLELNSKLKEKFQSNVPNISTKVAIVMLWIEYGAKVVDLGTNLTRKTLHSLISSSSISLFILTN